MNELKPCPLCGSDAKFRAGDSEFPDIVSCNSEACGLVIATWDNDDDLIGRWNRLPRKTKQKLRDNGKETSGS